MCWGLNELGQSDPPGSKFDSISSAGSFTCGLRTDSLVVCWGDAEFCLQRGDRGSCNKSVSAPDGKFSTLSVGDAHLTATSEWLEPFLVNHVCGLREVPGKIICFGDGITPTSDSIMSTSPRTPVCGVRTDGAMVCWENHLSDTPQGYEFVSVSVGSGGRFACGLLFEGTVLCWGYNDDGQSSPKGGRYAVPSIGPSARALPSGNSSGPTNSFDAASVLARFSTTDPTEGEKRAAAASEIVAAYDSQEVGQARVLDLMHTMAPELSIDERRRAADELAQLSEDDSWTTAETAFYLGALMTGDEPNAEERIEAANEMVLLYEAGELDANRSLELMDTIAPSLGITERRQAAAVLVKLSADDDWDDADRMAAASEVFRLVTGVPLDAEQRMGATVDLAGVGVKIFDTDDSYSDREIDAATAIIKQSLIRRSDEHDPSGHPGVG